MGKAPTIEKQRAPEAPTCQHHWIIETPHGATSRGRCKRCGAEREFRNSTNDYLWDDDGHSSYSPWSGSRSIPKVADDDEMSASSGEGKPALVV